MDGNSLANASVIIYKIYRFREAERRAGEKFTRFTRFRSLASRRKIYKIYKISLACEQEKKEKSTRSTRSRSRREQVFLTGITINWPEISINIILCSRSIFFFEQQLPAIGQQLSAIFFRT